MIQLTQVRRVSPLRPLQTFSLANKVQGVYRPERNESYMTVNITAKKIQVTQAFSDYATKKIEAKLDRFFSGDADCKVTLSEQKNMIQSAQQDLYSVQSKKRQIKTMLLMPA